jgi:hypothetical protein
MNRVRTHNFSGDEHDITEILLKVDKCLRKHKILEAKRRDEICLSSPKSVEPFLVFEMKDPYGIWSR